MQDFGLVVDLVVGSGLDMEFGFAFVASAAEKSSDGRFSVLGGGPDGFAVEAVPVVVPAMAVVLQLKFSAEECGQPYRIRMRIRRPNGEHINPGHMHEVTPQIDEYFPDQIVNSYISVNISNCVFREVGIHGFEFLCGDDVIGSIPFGITLIDGARGQS